MFRVTLLLCSLALVGGGAAAQSLLEASEWLPRGSRVAADLIAEPAEPLGPESQNFYEEYGRLAFRSPEILGGNARKAGLACNSCHTNGNANARFFVEGLSDRPGAVDVTHSLWNARGEDGRFNPLQIPSLKGVKQKPRLGHDGRFASLRDFTRHVIVVEFAGDEPDALLLDALVAYQMALQPDRPSALQPVSLARALADLDRFAATLNVPLLEENAALAARIAGMVRRQVGRIDQRFHRPEHAAARELLSGWSRALQALAATAQRDDFPAARAELASWRAGLKDIAVLRDAEPTSLYDAASVKAALEGQ